MYMYVYGKELKYFFALVTGLVYIVDVTIAKCVSCASSRFKKKKKKNEAELILYCRREKHERESVIYERNEI